MSIEKCRECKGKVSSDARTCPHCGVDKPYEPPPPPTKWEKRFGSFVLYIILALLAWGGWKAYNYKPTPKTPKEIAEQKKREKEQKRKDKKRDREWKEQVDLPAWCKHSMRKAARSLGGSIDKWGRNRTWKKGRNLVFFSQRFSVEGDLGGLSYFRVTCKYNHKTDRVDVVKIDQV